MVLHFHVSCLVTETLAPFFHPIRGKTKTNCDWLVHVFPLFALATCVDFEFWLIHWIARIPSYWLEWEHWFWFYDSRLKNCSVCTCLITLQIECVHCHAIKNKIKNHSVNKVKKLWYYIIDDELRRQFFKFKVCALSQSWDIRRNVPRKIIEPSMEPPCWKNSLVLQYGGRK